MAEYKLPHDSGTGIAKHWEREQPIFVCVQATSFQNFSIERDTSLCVNGPSMLY